MWAFGAALLAALSLIGCGKEETTGDGQDGALAPAPAPAGANDTPAAPPPPPPPSVFREDGEAGWYYGPANRQDGEAQVLIDNGLQEAVTLTLPDGSAVKIEPQQMRTLRLGSVPGHTPAQVAIQAQIGPAAAQSFSLAARSGTTYLFNPGAAWNYSYETQEYSTINTGFSDGHRATALDGLVLFQTGRIDYLFGEFPESVDIQTFGGYGQATKRRLIHTGSSPTDRVVATGSYGGQPYWLAQTGENAYSLSTPEAEASSIAKVYIDGVGEKIGVGLGTDPLFRVEDALAQLALTPGQWALSAADLNGQTLTPLKAELAAGRYLWSPSGSHSYQIDYELYGTSMPGYGGSTPETEQWRGLSFVPIRTRLAFEPFPSTVKTGGYLMVTTVSRFSADRSVPQEGLQAQLEQEYQAAVAAARAAAGKHKAALEALLTPLKAPRDDLQIRLAQTAAQEFLLAARGDTADMDAWEAVVDGYRSLTQFEPAWPQLHVRMGTAQMAAQQWDDALDSFDEAIALQPDLAAGLATKQAACRKAIEAEEAAEDAEDARRAEEENDQAAPGAAEEDALDPDAE